MTSTSPDFASKHTIDIAAAPDRVYGCLRAADMGRSRPMRLLLSVRGLRGLRTLDDAIAAGFAVVEDDPPHTLLLGLVGRPWRPSGGLQPLSGPELLAFTDPGFVKVLWRFEIEDISSGSRVVTTTDIYATSADAMRSFGRYWRFVAPFSGMLRKALLAQIKACAET